MAKFDLILLLLLLLNRKKTKTYKENEIELNKYGKKDNK